MDLLLNQELIRTGVIVLLAALLIFVILRGLARAKTAERDGEQEPPDDASQPPLTSWARVVGRQFYRRTWFVTFEMENGDRMTLPCYAYPVPEICEEGTLTIRNGQCVGFERG